MWVCVLARKPRAVLHVHWMFVRGKSTFWSFDRLWAEISGTRGNALPFHFGYSSLPLGHKVWPIVKMPAMNKESFSIRLNFHVFIYLDKIAVASICFLGVTSPYLICSLLPVNELIHYASRSYFSDIPLQNNLKYAAINATQKNCHICVPRLLGSLKPCSWLKGDSILSNGLHRKSIGKNYCLKILLQANVRFKNIYQ